MKNYLSLLLLTFMFLSVDAQLQSQKSNSNLLKPSFFLNGNSNQSSLNSSKGPRALCDLVFSHSDTVNSGSVGAGISQWSGGILVDSLDIIDYEAGAAIEAVEFYIVSNEWDSVWVVIYDNAISYGTDSINRGVEAYRANVTSSIVTGAYNRHVLPDSIPLTTSNEYVVEIEFIQNTAGVFPFGTDGSALVNGKGAWVWASFAPGGDQLSDFNIGGNWQISLCINGQLFYPANEIALDEVSFNPNYIITPVSQANPSGYVFNADVSNLGRNDFDSVFINIDTNGTAFDQIVVSPLDSGNSGSGASNNLVLNSVGTYNLDFNAFTDSAEFNSLNNDISVSLELSDSVYAREDGIATGSLGFPNGTIDMGSVFEIISPDTVTSISFWLNNPAGMIGDDVSVSIFNFDNIAGSVGTQILASATLTVTDSTPGWRTIPVASTSSVLSAGFYLIASNQLGNNNYAQGTTSLNFQPGVGFFRINTGAWQNIESQFARTVMIRPNFGSVDQTVDYAFISAEYDYDFTIVPDNQLPPFGLTFSAEVENLSFQDINNVTLTAEVANAGYLDSASVSIITSGASNQIVIPSAFNPTNIGVYDIDFTLTADETDQVPGNNLVSQRFEVSDSVLARDNGIASGSLSGGAPPNATVATLGQTFTIPGDDDLSSVSVWLDNPTIGEPLSVSLYSFSGQPSTEISTTAPVNITSDTAGWRTFKFDSLVPVSSGTLYIGVNEALNGQATIGTESENFQTGVTWITLDGGSTWDNNEAFMFNVIYLIRPNFQLDTTTVSPVANFTYVVNNLTVDFTDATTGDVTNYLWDFDDSNTSISQNPIHTYAASGVYNVCLTAFNGNDTSVYCENVNVITGLDNALENGVEIYPNPTKEVLTIESKYSELTSISIINSLGEPVLSIQSVNQPVITADVSALKSGLYYVRMNSLDGFITKKLIIQ